MPLNTDFYVQWTLAIGPYTGVALTAPHSTEGVGTYTAVMWFNMGASNRFQVTFEYAGVRTVGDVIQRLGGISVEAAATRGALPTTSSTGIIDGVAVGTTALTYTFRVEVVSDVVTFKVNGVPFSGSYPTATNPFQAGVGNPAAPMTLVEARTSPPVLTVTTNVTGHNYGSGAQNWPGSNSGFSTNALPVHPDSFFWTDFVLSEELVK
jgi:hypothetical protein